MYAKDLNEPKYQFLIKKREDVGIKHLNDSKAFIEYLQYMDDVSNNTNDYNSNRKRKLLIVFDNMIADIMTKKKFQAIIIELFIRCRKWSTSLVFITQSYFSVPMSENEIKNGKPYNLVDIIENFFDFNNQNQEGKGLKMLTPDQILSRLPISVAQNNL